MTNKPTVDFEAALRAGGMPTTEAEVKAEFQKVVDDEGMITNTSKMSPFWRLITAIVTKPVIWLKDILVTVVMANMYLATATGAYLDLFAWAVNLSRKDPTFTQGVISFFKSDPTLLITVPAGTVIQTERIDDKVYRVMTVAEVVIPAGTASQAIPVKAEASGTAYNLAPGYFRILPTDIPGISRVENLDNWLTQPGADQESDDELRDRSRNQYNLVGSYHIDAVYRSMIASVAGLSTDRVYFEHDAPRGPGTANAYLLLDTGVPADSFIAAVNDHIMVQGYHGHGDDMHCFAMPETQHDLTITAYMFATLNLTDDEQTDLKQDIENFIRCAFRDNATYEATKTWPHSRFSFSRLGEELHLEFSALESIKFSLGDIISGLSVPRLASLNVVLTNG
ncbi:baseplate J/gp47 family protein [Serratia liquefaciens]|uniref:baseplate J/gp47 family protein n=1 Tax=Serratia liquefaciens TaxID=614 RepID=UPI000DFF297D|nr:baseplate J/gp47 family protein [Serratia liquefaciens]MBF8107380.1 baseplate J/gp47 family protein [Serratia liquefaciens]SUI44799.1 Uncharacterized homolog of phage Mu protein gp47 [Serratia liquefaciens]